ncbi:MAG: type II toxin-antitoxin system death-on-curing family toxin [Rhodospirillales bacterium]|jgi:death-on-curing protein|nr:type II toxin-antitoxin system death-on-curing family toxin [Rhodospirillales bacterium]MDP6884378.1 type II toxin-antitoxin system death-on-curing family toxin [Rhodospirillales bacterium]
MKEPIWLLTDAIVAVQSTLIAEHGGLSGVRDPDLLESALAQARTRYAYDPETTLFDLAAAYAFGLARSHPFLDGNKRIAITAVAMFLGVNDFRFVPDKLDALKTFLALAAGGVEESELAQWIAANAESAVG